MLVGRREWILGEEVIKEVYVSGEKVVGIWWSDWILDMILIGSDIGEVGGGFIILFSW